MKTIFYIGILVLALSGCKKYESEDNFAAVEIIETPASLQESAARHDKTYAPQDNVAAIENFEQKIIKNANLVFESPDLDKTAASVQNLVKKYKATVQDDKQENNDYRLSRNITIRIPSVNFEPFLFDLGKGVDYFEHKEISAQDVTEEFIDVDARVKAKKVLESRYLELLKKANKVSEMLEIEKKLSGIREEIEAQEGTLKYIQNRVAMSTINITFYKEQAQGTTARQSYGSKLWTSLGTGFNSLSSFLLELVNIWPFILIFVIAIVLIRKRIKRKRKQNV